MSKIVGLNGKPHEREEEIVAEALAVEGATAEPEEGKPEPWPGQCSDCGQLVKVEDIETMEGKPPLHPRRPKRGHIVGELCGPVVTKWLYSCSYVIQAADGGFQFERRREVIPCPINAGNAIEKLEDGLRDSVQLPESVAPPKVTLMSFALLGTV